MEQYVESVLQSPVKLNETIIEQNSSVQEQAKNIEFYNPLPNEAANEEVEEIVSH